jgi:hypothetical protein
MRMAAQQRMTLRRMDDAKDLLGMSNLSDSQQSWRKILKK